MMDYRHVNKDEYISHNGRVQPVARESDDLALTDLSAAPKFVIGNDVSLEYEDHMGISCRPFQRCVTSSYVFYHLHVLPTFTV